MLEHLFSRPFAYLYILLLAADIHTYYVSPIPLSVIYTLLAISILILIYCVLIRQYNIITPGLMICFLLVSYAYFANHYVQITNKHIDSEQHQNHSVIVVHHSHQHTKHLSILAECISTPKPFLIQLTHWNTCPIEKLYYGDTLMGAFNMERIYPSTHRQISSFDRYLLHQEIYYKGSSKCGNFRIHKNNRVQFKSIVQKSADWIKNVLNKYQEQENPQNIALLTGLLLGDKSLLDKSSKELFTENGLSHILAVSGMHLVFFFYLVQWCIKWGGKIGLRLSISNEIVISLTLIWCYAMITGLGVAVLRAALMLTIYKVACLIGRRSDPTNVLSGIALLLTILNPMIPFDAGFQLTMASLAALFWVNPMIQRVVNTVNPIVKYLWDLLSTCFCVQMVLSPICIYHFEAFPVYFLLSNLLWIPLSSALMALGILLVCMHQLSPSVARLIADVTGSLSEAGISYLQFLNKLPGSTLENLYIEVQDCIFYYGILFALLLIIRKGNLKYTCIWIFIEIATLSYYFHREKEITQRRCLAGYRTEFHLQVEVYHQGICYTTYDFDKNMQRIRLRHGVNKVLLLDSLRMQNVIHSYFQTDQ